MPSMASDPSSEMSRKTSPGVRFDKPADRRLTEENDSGRAGLAVAGADRNLQMAGSSSTMKQTALATCRPFAADVLSTAVSSFAPNKLRNSSKMVHMNQTTAPSFGFRSFAACD